MARSLQDKQRPDGVGQGAKLWVVEMQIDWRWVPTVGVAFIKKDGLLVLADWQNRNPDDTFRLHKYWREGGTN